MSRLPSVEAPEERAVLVLVNQDASEDGMIEAELEGLCEAADVTPVVLIRQRVERPTSATFIGKGKLEEVQVLVKETNANVVLVDTELSGIQHRNLEKVTGAKVVDRTQLILDIFARRAKTREGMLQVELAQLTYMMPRLMSVYTKFERQKGGIGFRGPGETKLESDRRMVRDRVAKLKDDLSEVQAARNRQRAGRRKHPFPFVSLVGYTSAGKSTLMNRLAGTDLLADAMPFATLDPTTRKIDLPDGYSLFLTDTVGFIRNLPTYLVAAFRATLEEVTYSDFLIHVVDASNEAWEVQRDAVCETLESLKAESKPIITVFNKVDLIPERRALVELVSEFPHSVAISAETGEGMGDLLLAALRQVRVMLAPVKALVPYDKSTLVQACYDYGRILKEEYRDDGIYIEAELVDEMREKLAPYIV